MSKEILCPHPRCGRPVSWFERRRRGDRIYIYAVHYNGGRKEVCYLGPAESYRYVERFERLTLRGLTDSRRFKDYVRRAAASYIMGRPSTLGELSYVEADDDNAKEILNRALELQDELRKLLAHIQMLINKLKQTPPPE